MNSPTNAENGSSPASDNSEQVTTSKKLTFSSEEQEEKSTPLEDDRVHGLTLEVSVAQESQDINDEQDSSKRPSKFIDASKCREDLLSKKLYEKVVLKLDFPAVILDNTAIKRPAGTTFRVGDEIFVCNQYRSNTAQRKFLFYGFVRDKADVKYCQCVLHEPATRLTRTAPLLYIAHIPEGKVAGETLREIAEADTAAYAWMQEVRLLGHDLAFWDSGSTAKNPRRPQYQNPRYSGDEFSCTELTKKNETLLHTPPYARRLQETLNKLGTNAKKPQMVNAALAKVSAENTKLKDELKEQKKLAANLEKDKKKLEQQLEEYRTKQAQSAILEDVNAKLDFIHSAVQRISCSTANPFNPAHFQSYSFGFPMPSKQLTMTKKAKSHCSDESSSESDSPANSDSSSSDDSASDIVTSKKRNKDAGKRKKNSGSFGSLESEDSTPKRHYKASKKEKKKHSKKRPSKRSK